jgi:hypothetical protein
MSTACIMPIVLVRQHVAVHDGKPLKSSNRERNVTDVGRSGVPSAGSGIVSSQYGSTATPVQPHHPAGIHVDVEGMADVVHC